MKKKVLIAGDSTCDLSKELIERYGVKILPLGVTLGDAFYKDGVDIDPDTIYRHYESTGELPKTAAINIGEFTDFFRDCTADGSAVVFFTISAEMSSTCANAKIAAEEFEDVYVVDTRNLSTGGGLLVLAACDMAEEGLSAAEIAEACAAMADRVDASFVIDSLEFLHKGGRCSAVAAFGANLLQLKPRIVVRGGKMGVGGKYRGKFSSVIPKYIAEQIGGGEGIDKTRVFVTHAGCDEDLCRQTVELVRSAAPFKEVLLTRAGCTISSHCGRNTLGVLFLRDEPLK